MRGCYIAIEGGDGAGKSTQAGLLASHLGAVCTREPGATVVGARLRELLLDPGSAIDPRTEALLMAADRAQHRAEVLEPTLAGGRHVVSDRSVYSSLAYQGGGRRMSRRELVDISRFALDSCWPDMVVLLRVDRRAAAQRLEGRTLDRFEREDEGFAGRVEATFDDMARSEPDRWRVVDASGEVDDVARNVRQVVDDWMNSHSPGEL